MIVIGIMAVMMLVMMMPVRVRVMVPVIMLMIGRASAISCARRPMVMMVVQQAACRRGQKVGRDCNSASKSGDEHCDTIEGLGTN
jgi:hypothetical protein